MDDDKPKSKNSYQVLPKEAYLKKVKFFGSVLAMALLSVVNFSHSKTLHHVVDIFEFVICGGVIMMVFLNKDKIEKAYAKKTSKL